MSQQKRFQVFVSSTYGDLVVERQAVTSALLQLDAFPSGMEIFPAADDDAWTLIERIIDECDYYLLIIGGKYGSIHPDLDLSYTEREYDYAVARRKPVMAFLHARPMELPVSAAEIDPDARANWARFCAKVRATRHVKCWRTAEELAGQVALSFAHFTKQYPAVGWIRADRPASVEVLTELNDLRKQVAALQAQLAEAAAAPPPGTEGLAAGDEEYVLVASVTAKVKRSGATISATVPFSITWDELVAALAPQLLAECSQTELVAALDRFLLIERWLADGVPARLAEVAAEQGQPGVPADAFHDESVAVLPESVGTIVMQLLALGLIRKGVRRRSVRDPDTYWTLTPWGEQRALRLRAVQTERRHLSAPPATGR